MKIGDQVIMPRTGGGYSSGKIVAVSGDKALVEFCIGKTYRGRTSVTPAAVGTKVVKLCDLKPAEEGMK